MRYKIMGLYHKCSSENAMWLNYEKIPIDVAIYPLNDRPYQLQIFQSIYSVSIIHIVFASFRCRIVQDDPLAIVEDLLMKQW